MNPHPSAPRPAFCAIALFLGISAFVGALVSAIMGEVFARQGEATTWLPYALGAALLEAVLSMEVGRRAGAVGHPHATLRKVASGFALAALLIVAMATLARVA